MDDFDFRTLLTFFDLSWQGYRRVRKGVKKRLHRFMRENNCINIQALLKTLENNKTLRDECVLLLTVPISRFFRDRELWFTLSGKIIQDLVSQKDNVLHVWSAGCASGEEAYSLGILITWMRDRGVRLPLFKITATDINGDSLKRARTGVFTSTSLKEVPQAFKTRFFDHIKKGNLYRLKSFLKTDITWQVHNFFHSPPAKAFSLVFARNNLFTYYSSVKQEAGLRKIVSSLHPGGFLIIGVNEKLPERFKELFVNKYHPSVFLKRPG